MNQLSRQILRFSLVFLLCWFGWQQLAYPEAWMGYLPEWTGYLPVPAETLIRMNGWFELMAAVFLAAGIYAKFVALIVAAHLVVIAFEVGGAIGVRDFVLGAAALSLAFSEPDDWTCDVRCQKTPSSAVVSEK